jgi:hypothetical protein
MLNDENMCEEAKKDRIAVDLAAHAHDKTKELALRLTLIHPDGPKGAGKALHLLGRAQTVDFISSLIAVRGLSATTAIISEIFAESMVEAEGLRDKVDRMFDQLSK